MCPTASQLAGAADLVDSQATPRRGYRHRLCARPAEVLGRQTRRSSSVWSFDEQRDVGSGTMGTVTALGMTNLFNCACSSRELFFVGSYIHG